MQKISTKFAVVIGVIALFVNLLIFTYIITKNFSLLYFFLLLSGKTIQGGKSVDLLMCETHCGAHAEGVSATV